jgi:hypothetical protein
MPLTKRQVDEVLDIIDRHMLSLTYEALGPRALTPYEIGKLKRMGLLRESVRHMTVDPSTLGKLVALLPPTAAAGITYDMVLRAVKNIPQTAVEKESIQYATDHAGAYIKGLRDTMVRDARAEVTRSAASASRMVQENVSEAIAERQTVGELKTRLFDSFEDRSRDWHRVAQTEMNNALQHGSYREIRKTSDDGADQLVFKRPNPDACKYCISLYLKEDGITPKVFKLKDLADSNFGRKAASWLPTVGSVHPYCACQLGVVPEGYSFVKMNTAKETFEAGDKTYRPGEIIPDDVYDGLSRRLKSKTKHDAILTHTGETARAD